MIIHATVHTQHAGNNTSCNGKQREEIHIIGMYVNDTLVAHRICY